MKKLSGLLLFFIFISVSLYSQLCPGGGTSFATAVTFNQSWIQGCLTGTSCNGGTEFDNRSGCEPTTSMDACAPAPSCTVNSQDGSDIWFKFYAMGSTATINIIQNVSFVVTVQVFSGGPACGTLTEIGCLKAGGPSSGITLNLTGLTSGNQYYYRVFGSSNAASQRTGTYCFCGSSGLGSSVLPVILASFHTTAQKGKIQLDWTTASESNSKWFDIERSRDGVHFDPIGRLQAQGNSSSKSTYRFTDLQPFSGQNYYRLKQVDIDNRFYYSGISAAKNDHPGIFQVFPVPASGTLNIVSKINTKATILHTTGTRILTLMIRKGNNEIDISKLSPGVYLLQHEDNGETIKFQVTKN